MVKESAPREQDAEQIKFYAPGVGNVRTGWTGTGAKATETLELVGIEQLDAKHWLLFGPRPYNWNRARIGTARTAYAKTQTATVMKADKTGR